MNPIAYYACHRHHLHQSSCLDLLHTDLHCGVGGFVGDDVGGDGDDGGGGDYQPTNGVDAGGGQLLRTDCGSDGIYLTRWSRSNHRHLSHQLLKTVMVSRGSI